MTVVTHLLAAVGTLTAVVLLLLMAVVPLLLDLPLPRSRWGRPTAKGRGSGPVPHNAVWPTDR